MSRTFRVAADGQLNQILDEVAEWALDTFPHSTPSSCAEHLRREVIELQENPSDPGEIADCLFLVVDLAQRAGVNLAEAARAKFEVLKARRWGEPDALGVVEHIRETEASV